MNSYLKKTLAFTSFVFFIIFSIVEVFANDTLAHVFTSQLSSGLWSNNSRVSVDANLEYINKWNNSSIIWNYFEWLYYDDIFWYFAVDYLPNPNENVRVIGSTSVCSSWYWYKLWGYAYSEYFWFIDFDYNSDIYVYYCLSDSSLHWYAYSETLGFQNFEGITFPIETQSDVIVEEPTSTGAFVNEETNILDVNISPQGADADSENSNFTTNTIQNDIYEFEVDRESLFYIIK